MKIKGQLQWTDYLNAQLLHMQPNGFIRVVRLVAYSFIALTFVILIFMSLLGQIDFDIAYMLPVFLLVVIFPLYRYVFLPNRIKKLFAQQKELSLPFEAEFTETGMSSSNEVGNSTRPWTNFIKWKENKDLFMLYHSDIMFNMIPKRCFTDPQQIETVRSFLEKNNVPKAKSPILASCVIYILLFIIIVAVVYINFMRAIYP